MQKVRTLFFGSAPESLYVLNVLKNWKSPVFSPEIVGIVTQPPRPVGRKKMITPTPPQTWAEKYEIPVLTFPGSKKTPWVFENEQTVTDSIQPLQPDLIVATYYGQKIPYEVIQKSTYGGLNIHPSLLPKWRGADPVPWAIVWGDHQVGISLVTLAENFDEGKIIAQKKIPLTLKDTAEQLYPCLFKDGAALFSDVLSDYLVGSLHAQPQGLSSTPYARRLTRDDGFIPWSALNGAMKGETVHHSHNPPLLTEIQNLSSHFSESVTSHVSLVTFIDRMYRALHPWPGVWTVVTIRGEFRRLKLLKIQPDGGKIIVDQVQLEGKSPVSFSSFSKEYLVF